MPEFDLKFLKFLKLNSAENLAQLPGSVNEAATLAGVKAAVVGLLNQHVQLDSQRKGWGLANTLTWATHKLSLGGLASSNETDTRKVDARTQAFFELNSCTSSAAMLFVLLKLAVNLHAINLLIANSRLPGVGYLQSEGVLLAKTYESVNLLVATYPNIDEAFRASLPKWAEIAQQPQTDGTRLSASDAHGYTQQMIKCLDAAKASRAAATADPLNAYRPSAAAPASATGSGQRPSFM